MSTDLWAELHKASLPLSAKRSAHTQVQLRHLQSRGPVHDAKQCAEYSAVARQARDGSRFRASVRLPRTKSLHKSPIRPEAMLSARRDRPFPSRIVSEREMRKLFRRASAHRKREASDRATEPALGLYRQSQQYENVRAERLRVVFLQSDISPNRFAARQRARAILFARSQLRRQL